MSLDMIDLDSAILEKVIQLYGYNKDNDFLKYVDTAAALDSRLVYKQEFLKKYNGGKLKIGVQPRLDYGMDLDSIINKIKIQEQPKKTEIKVESKKSFFDWVISLIRR